MTSFSKAFASARKSGKKNFSWQGKSYNTKLAKGDSSPKNVPTPGKKPSQVSATSTAAKAKPASGVKAGPVPMKDVGIARKGSLISQAKARADNAPVAKKTVTGRALQGPQIMAGAKARAAKASNGGKQGPTPEGVWYARKGSAISIGAARRANKPVKK
ncbi:hypothetical protein [Pararhizobium sp. A13]|uniref:hypothetical protein n=1 Tax=Pararhizobium sp. A13 TaxID=3133975 RepID=UPI003249CC1D